MEQLSDEKQEIDKRWINFKSNDNELATLPAADICHRKLSHKIIIKFVSIIIRITLLLTNSRDQYCNLTCRLHKF